MIRYIRGLFLVLMLIFSGIVFAASEVLSSDSVVLEWIAPTEYTDGSPYGGVDPDGFRIYYGFASGFYIEMFDVESSGARTQTIDGLNAGTEYCFVITAYDEANKESDYSNEKCFTTLDAPPPPPPEEVRPMPPSLL